MKKPSKLILKLCKKIQNDLGYECDAYSFRRTRAGYWQKSFGAWSWTIDFLNKGGARITIGSCETVNECVKEKYNLVVSYNEIFIETKK